MGTEQADGGEKGVSKHELGRDNSLSLGDHIDPSNCDVDHQT